MPSRVRARTVLVLLSLALAIGAAAPGASRAASIGFSVSAKPKALPPISSGFLGLALEYRSIPEYVPGTGPVDPVLLQLIRTMTPTGAPIIRIGGQSTDRTWWPISHYREPPGITYDLSDRWIDDTRQLVAATGARLLLGIELEANQPKIASVESQHLLALGRAHIAAMEIGNEPNLYSSIPWYYEQNGHDLPWYSHQGTPVYARGRGYGPAQWQTDFQREARVVPDVPLAGPDGGTIALLDSFGRLLSPRSQERMLTWHAYGLNQCVTDPHSPLYPTVPNLLTTLASRGPLDGIGPEVALAHRNGATFRIDEMGSITCNGRAGVSNTFAAALWAMDALFATASAGVDGVNLHTFPGLVNDLFDFSERHGRWTGVVRPVFYGVMMFARAAPAGSRLLPVRSDDAGAVRAWATLGADHATRVLLINDALHSSDTVHVAVPAATASASLQRLTARSAYATGGVSIAGRSFGASTTTGTLRAAELQVVNAHHGYTISLPAASAALLTVPGSGGGG